MDKRIERYAILVFRIIALPYSILSFIYALYQIFSTPSWDQVGMPFLAFSIFLPALLFKAALADVPPWKNKSLIKFIYIFGMLILTLALYIGSAFIVADTLEPIVGKWLSEVAALLVFIVLSIIIAMVIGKFEKKRH